MVSVEIHQVGKIPDKKFCIFLTGSYDDLQILNSWAFCTWTGMPELTDERKDWNKLAEAINTGITEWICVNAKV